MSPSKPPLTPEQQRMAHARTARKRKASVAPEDRPLGPMEARFVLEYVVDFNGADAARKAGYAVANAAAQASRLLTRANILTAIEAAKQEWTNRAKLTIERVQRDIVTAANLDVAELFDARGNLLPVRDLPPHVRRAIVSIEVIIKNAKAGDGVTDEVHKVKLIDKGKMFEILARATGLDKGEGNQVLDVPAFALPADTPGVSVH